MTSRSPEVSAGWDALHVIFLSWSLLEGVKTKDELEFIKPESFTERSEYDEPSISKWFFTYCLKSKNYGFKRDLIYFFKDEVRFWKNRKGI